MKELVLFIKIFSLKKIREDWKYLKRKVCSWKVLRFSMHPGIQQIESEFGKLTHLQCFTIYKLRSKPNKKYKDWQRKSSRGKSWSSKVKSNPLYLIWIEMPGKDRKQWQQLQRFAHFFWTKRFNNFNGNADLMIIFTQLDIIFWTTKIEGFSRGSLMNHALS